VGLLSFAFLDGIFILLEPFLFIGGFLFFGEEAVFLGVKQEVVLLDGGVFLLFGDLFRSTFFNFGIYGLLKFSE
jgi:hypothetical protein